MTLSAETKPVAKLTKIALTLLQERYNRDIEELVAAAAELEGVSEADGWKMDPSGVWFRPKPAPKVEAPDGSPSV